MSSVKDKWLRIGNVEIKATRCQYDIDLGYLTVKLKCSFILVLDVQ